MTKIETKRLMIREFIDSDIDNLYALLSDPKVMQYCSGVMNRVEAKKWLESIMKYYSEYGYDYFAVIEKSTGKFIGQSGIIKQKIDDELIDCVAFMITKDKWGMGYATEVGKACISYGLQNLNIKKLYATVENDNRASQAVLKKLGMTFERESYFYGNKVKLYSLNNVINL
ncbi:GNAT family N-acetyltransferase [Clostridiaceae bacterium M8S5]|nr:GNAT family N-acetyltransferase [Clostridiaceae bacterium M8S5]